MCQDGTNDERTARVGSVWACYLPAHPRMQEGSRPKNLLALFGHKHDISLRSSTACHRSRHPGRALVVSLDPIAAQLSNDDPCQVLESRRHPRP